MCVCVFYFGKRNLTFLFFKKIKNKQNPPPPCSNGIWAAREICPAATRTRNLIREVSNVIRVRGLAGSREADPTGLVRNIRDTEEHTELV